jgi:hypothetical protein
VDIHALKSVQGNANVAAHRRGRQSTALTPMQRRRRFFPTMKRKRTASPISAARAEPAVAAPAPASAAATTPAPQRVDAINPLDALSRSQQGLVSAESFWKSAGRFCRLR